MRSLFTAWGLAATLVAAGCGEVVMPGQDAMAPPDLAQAPQTDDGGADGGADAATATPSAWLHTTGNHIYTADGKVWHGRGANLQDTRGCGACAFGPPDPAEVMRRADVLVDDWGANFVRLTLESYGASPGAGAVHWRSVVDDPAYLADVKAIVAHLTGKPGVYVLLSLWIDPSFDAQGRPTAESGTTWQRLAAEFLDEPKVLFGLVNEPENNFDGAQDPAVWQAMNDTVARIREVEDAAKKPRHVVLAQGTGGWARHRGYYVDHPLTAGGGENIAYEGHVYDPKASFAHQWIEPARHIPVVIGEFGPASGYMTEDDCAALMNAAEQAEVPYLAWTFHMRCPPNLIVDHSSGGCGSGMTLEPTSWGRLLKDRLAKPW